MMSMRRKILCVLLVIMTALAVAACGGDNSQDSSQNAFEAFTEVQKNMEDIRDAEFKMSMDMTTDAAGEDDEVTMKMSGTGKEILKSKSDIEMEMNYNMTMPGLESGLKGTMYMQGQIVYMDMMGQKFKMDASNEIAAAMNMDTSQLLDISEDMISDITMSEDGSDTVYNIKMDGNKALDYLEKNAGNVQGMAGATEALKFNKMDVVVVAGEDGMVKTIDMDCAMSSGSGEEAMDVTYQISMEYLGINTDLKIDFPDFSDYQELTV